MQAVDSSTEQTRRARPRRTAGLWLALVFLAAALPLALRDFNAGRGWSDQSYHLRAIHKFAAEWPRFDFRDYSSATTPGFHVFMATIERWITPDVRVLRAVSAALTAALLCTVGLIPRRQGEFAFFCCGLPLVTSLYVFSSGAWALPDNVGWWGVLAVLLLAWRDGDNRRWDYLAAALLLALVFCRQSHVWAAAVTWVAAVFSRPGPPETLPQADARRGARTVLLTLPAFAVVGSFAWLWKGLMPPSMAHEIRHGWYSPENLILEGPNWATPAFSLAVLGVLGVWYVPLMLPQIDRLRARARWIAAAAAIAAVISVLPVTEFAPGTRASGIWNFVRMTPVLAHRSPLLIALAVLGGVILAAWAVVLPPRRRVIWLTAWVCFVIAQVPNPSAFQRYHEPFALLMLLLAIGTAAPPAKRWMLAGPVTLAILLAMITLRGLR